MRESNRLTAIKVSKLSKPGRYADGHGLWLQVSKWGTKSWVLRYMRGGQARTMGLGPLHTIGLAQARDRARRAREQLLDRVDPINARREKDLAAKAEAAKLVTFREAAERYIKGHQAGWKNPKHGDQWRATLETYAYPTIGDLSVAAVDTGHVTEILEPVWTSKTETASRVRGRIEAVLDWAAAREYRRGDNPARWRGHLEKLLPAKSKVRAVQHMPAMPYVNVPAFMAELRGHKVLSAWALEFTILTACRTGEAIGARWDEIDFSAKIWTVPGKRTKSGREHRVPLSERALQVISEIPREAASPHLFPGNKTGKPLSNMAMLELLRGMRGGGLATRSGDLPVHGGALTVHGFRSSFRDWAAEQTNYPREIAEAALAHVLGDKTEAAYQRGDLLEKRRKLMQAWAGYCGGRGAAAGQVVPLRKASA